ncbi:MAG: carboxypeptidase regulatory-like domain-containing protein [Candidatus Palauibacterales bacterium]|nr:carboxypeptidase regulatory-like domain-containing protein [Candidatus Palauibacterales bacterium]
MLRYWLRGAFRAGLATAGLALFAASPLFGQASTGKIQGRVTDAGTGAPIAGAQILVDGTTLGNLTNDQGFYFINEVPAGLQNVRAQFIGYRPFVIENQRILAGQTTTMNFELEQTAVELEAITVEGDRNPLVPRDQTSTKSIIQGEAISELPLDNASSIVVLQPGVVQTNSGVTIRGGRANEEAVFIDGVLIRSFGQADANNVSIPTNALEQVDVNVGAFAAEYGEAQSGVVSYVTRSGGAQFTGSLEFFSDQLGPNSWRTNFNRAELTLGGPVAGPLTFFFAGTAQGQQSNRTEFAPERWVISGIDTCPSASQYASLCTAGEPAVFSNERSSSTAGATDYVDIAALNYVPWDNGRTNPDNWSQSDLFTFNLNWQLPRGSRVNFAFTRNRDQAYGRGGFTGLYNPDNYDGNLNTRNVFTLGWFQTITQTADQQIALDLRASYQTDRFSNGTLTNSWWQDNRDPFLGFTFGNVEFLLPEDFQVTGFNVFDFDDEFLNAYRSNAVPYDSMRYYPQRNELAASQSLTGLSQNLRANPYGERTGYAINGYGNTGLSKVNEDRFQLRGTLDWQLGRFNRVKLGGEWLDIDMLANNIPLYTGVPLPEHSTPTRIGAFLQDRLDIGDLVLEGGVRWDYLDPGVEYSRVPGYIFNVPDSLKQGFVRLNSSTGEYEPLNACGPESFDPSAPCKSNFIEGTTKSEFSPRIGASFPVTPTSTFRLSYGRFVQTPAFFTNSGFSSGIAGTASQTVGFLQNTNSDLVNQNTNATWGRDIDMPSTRTFEFGYRQLIGQDLVLDVSAFNKKQRSALAVRKLQFSDPNREGAFTFLNVVTNRDWTEANGFEAKVDKAFGNLSVNSLTYSFVDARGTGSDPYTYTQLILRAVSNLSLLTGAPENPPEVLLPLEESRKHNISLTSSLAFPVDYMQGSTLGAILSDFGVYAVLRLRSGLPYTKLINTGNGQIGPPSVAGLEGRPQSSISNTETPWTTAIDMRFTKGFQIGQNWNLQAFIDWRNPFNISSYTTVFLETAGTVNQQFRDAQLLSALTDTRLDGDNLIDDFDIATESPETDYNKFSLMRAEERWGNGDGVFTVEEQNIAFGQGYESTYGQNVRFDTSDQLFRIGLRIAF